MMCVAVNWAVFWHVGIFHLSSAVLQGNLCISKRVIPSTGLCLQLQASSYSIVAPSWLRLAMSFTSSCIEWHTHTHTHLTALFPGLPRWAGTRKVIPIWILMKQETVSGSGISWAICKSAPCSRQITMPAPHRSIFYSRMPFLPPNQQRQSTEGTYIYIYVVFYQLMGATANMLIILSLF